MRDITLRIKGKWVQASLFAVALLALTAAVTFAFAPLKVFRPSYSLHTFFRGTEGLQPNSSVEMDGIAVGRVSRVRLGPRATDGTLNPDRSIEVILDIEKRFQQEILSDSRATVEVQGLLGNSFVSIRRGSSGKVLADWSELPSLQPPVFNGGIVLQRMADRLADSAKKSPCEKEN